MPIYEYQCVDCSHAFETMQKFSDEPIKVCPKCSGKNVSKLISQSSFTLKGGGWFKSGYSSCEKKEEVKAKADEAGTKPPCSGCPSC
ncbi:MAG: zinc ribbon domain-containing protein [Deltaproteobacteria bacterium]|nr:zinc ribbon domain-containing protein [Deltaproteobacteria bacterium]